MKRVITRAFLLARPTATSELTSWTLQLVLSRAVYSPFLHYILNAKVKVGSHSNVVFAVVVTRRVRFSNLCMFFCTYIHFKHYN
jgi:hypothetical protein